MIVYVACRNFMHRTFVLVAEPCETVARLRAQLLHILHEIGHEKYYFRLRLNGQYLRDSAIIADSDIVDNSVIHMITTAVYTENNSTFFYEKPRNLQNEVSTDVYSALHREIKALNSRETRLNNFKTLTYVLCLVAIFAVFSIHWYAIFWTGLLALSALWFFPTYTRVGGFVGNNTIWRNAFCWFYSIASAVLMLVAIVLSILYWVKVTNHGCKDYVFAGDCSTLTVYTAVYFSFQALFLLMHALLAGYLLRNFKMEIGDFIEEFLMRERNVADILQTAQSTLLNDKRSAAFELSAIASTDNDDDKFRIVAEGGLDTLVSLTLSADTQTQEHAIDAILNLIIIPSIRDAFIDIGGARTASALLNSPSLVAMETASRVLYLITSECADRCIEVISNHGLDDLCHAALHGTDSCKQFIASVYLELAFDSEIRDQMVARSSTGRALKHLCESNNTDTLRYSLQALELLALCCPDLVTSQETLLDVLMGVPSRVHDDRIALLVTKILLYYAESNEANERLLYQKHLRTTLSLLSYIPDVVIQKVIIQIIASLINNDDLRILAVDKGLGSIVEYLRENALNRDVWLAADQDRSVKYFDLSIPMSIPVVQAVDKGESTPNKKPASLRQFDPQDSLS